MFRKFTYASCALILFCGSNSFAAGAYDGAAQSAANYLEATQNTQDGSWGVTDNLKPLYTAEAVQALYFYNLRTKFYYAGITWLENHRTINVDYTSRRIMALSPTKNDLTSDYNYLVQSQSLAAPGNNGWGVSRIYQGSTLDTALTLQALMDSITTIANIPVATTYLQSAQLTGADKGWPLAQEGLIDPTVTAQVIIALVPRIGASSIVITNAVNTLKTKVSTSSPVSVQALAARAYLAVAANSTDATPLLNNLKALQAPSGSIGGDAYTTALAMRAFAMSAGKDLASQRDTVIVPDQNLRNAINKALSKNAMDSLNKGELANLTSLDISGRNVKNLVGLEWAVNLTYLNASNNQLASTAPINGLTNLTQVVLNGNPSNPTYVPPVRGIDVPTIPEWGMIILGLLMFAQIIRPQNRSRFKQ